MDGPVLTEPQPHTGHSCCLFPAGFEGGLQNASQPEGSPAGKGPPPSAGCALFSDCWVPGPLLPLSGTCRLARECPCSPATVHGDPAAAPHPPHLPCQRPVCSVLLRPSHSSVAPASWFILQFLPVELHVHPSVTETLSTLRSLPQLISVHGPGSRQPSGRWCLILRASCAGVAAFGCQRHAVGSLFQERCLRTCSNPPWDAEQPSASAACAALHHQRPPGSPKSAACTARNGRREG